MLPSPELIERGLCAATERFAAELVKPQLDAPVWTDFEWQMARAAAVLHGITPLLATTLQWSGPASWQAFVREQRHQTLLRYGRIAAVLKDIDDQATAQGLPVVALKGAALHALGIYAPGERPMADIDLLVRPVDAERAAQLLASLGYAQTWAVWKHQVFEPAKNAAKSALPVGEHADYPVKVDLHIHIAERLPLTETAITELVFPHDAKAGLNPYPSSNALLLHLLLHAAGNLCGRGLRLMHLHDIARLAVKMTPEEWGRLMGAVHTPKQLWWALPPLELLNRYQPGVVPPQVLAALRAACPWALRRLCRRANLTQMSYASLAICAFPGLAWCTSLSERLRYVRQRILPDPEHIATRKFTAAEQWAVQRPWSHLPQGRRMLQWLISRPPRQAPMYIVQAVLENPLRS
ncbi:MAG TPA: nucleotidyltransferase family protein [Steroidobacteraceae bacterium]|nr:nucleotidyltransferase family protein [Steroidobacteraceae bacterium]